MSLLDYDFIMIIFIKIGGYSENYAVYSSQIYETLFETTRDIKAGEEIFFDYGFNGVYCDQHLATTYGFATHILDSFCAQVQFSCPKDSENILDKVLKVVHYLF